MSMSTVKLHIIANDDDDDNGGGNVYSIDVNAVSMTPTPSTRKTMTG